MRRTIWRFVAPAGIFQPILNMDLDPELYPRGVIPGLCSTSSQFSRAPFETANLTGQAVLPVWHLVLGWYCWWTVWFPHSIVIYSWHFQSFLCLPVTLLRPQHLHAYSDTISKALPSPWTHDELNRSCPSMIASSSQIIEEQYRLTLSDALSCWSSVWTKGMSCASCYLLGNMSQFCPFLSMYQVSSDLGSQCFCSVIGSHLAPEM